MDGRVKDDLARVYMNQAKSLQSRLITAYSQYLKVLLYGNIMLEYDNNKHCCANIYTKSLG